MQQLFAWVVFVSVAKFAELKILVVVVNVDDLVVNEPVKKYRVKLIAILQK